MALVKLIEKYLKKMLLKEKKFSNTINFMKPTVFLVNIKNKSI